MNVSNTETPSPVAQSGGKKRPRLRIWLVAVVLGFAALVAWMFWPAESAIDPYDLSRADGKSRFWVTEYSQIQTTPNRTLLQRASWAWFQYRRQHSKPNPASFTFAASPVKPCSIHGLLNQCMEATGTHYFVAVEIGGGVNFGNSNALNGTQWVASFEHAIETSGPVVCYDYAKKSNFQDTLLLIRERPGVVKVVPRSKLADYKKAGLVKE